MTLTLTPGLPVDAHLSSDLMSLTLARGAVSSLRLGNQPATDPLLTLEIGEPHPAPVIALGEDPRYVIANRRIRLTGATNFRDAGGLCTGDSQMIPWRRLYRSENLARLTGSDWQTLSDLGISKIIDLRSDEEIQANPTQCPTHLDMEMARIPISSEILGTKDATAAIASGALTKVTTKDMVDLYRELASEWGAELTAAADTLANASAPTLIHCTAGKDRTGIVVALMQLRAGVDRLDVYEDYLRSSLYRTPVRYQELRERFRCAGVNPRDVHPYLSTAREALDAALDILLP